MMLRQFFTIVLMILAAGALTACGDEQTAHGDHGAAAASEPAGHGDEHENEHGHEGEGKESSGEVHLTKEQAELLSIEVDKALSGSASGLISAPATLAFDPDLTARVGPRLPAKVVAVQVDLGDRVKKGQVLAEMDSVALGEAKAEYLMARAETDFARDAYEREKSLARQNISSEIERLEARARFQRAQANLESRMETLRLYGLSRQTIETIGRKETVLSRFTLKAPKAGIIQRRDLSPGQTVSAEETPIHIVDTRHLWVMIDAFEKSIPHLAAGQQVHFRNRALPERTFTGQVDWISRALDSQSRTLTVRAVLDNREDLLRAGMAGTAVVEGQSEARHALVPVDAIQRIDGETLVFVPGEKPGAYRAVEVALGDEDNGFVEVREGLNPGDPVVFKGAFDLMSAMTASGRSAAHSH